MKKTYQNPQTDILTMSMSELMSASLGNGPDPNNIDLSTAGTTDATSGNLSRRTLWDDTDDGDEY